MQYIVVWLLLAATGTVRAQSRLGQKAQRLEAVSRSATVHDSALRFEYNNTAVHEPVATQHFLRDNALSFLKRTGGNNTARSGLNKTFTTYYRQPTFEDRIFRARGLESRLDSTNARVAVTSSLSTGAKKEFEKSISVLNEFKAGVNFNLDLSNPFGSGNTGPKDTIRYGTVINDIDIVDNFEPSMDSQYFLAAASAPGAISDEELAFMQPAQVQWSVGQISKGSQERIRTYIDPYSYEPPPFHVYYTDQVLDPKIDFGIKPVEADLGNLDEDKGPQADVILRQKSEFYLLKYRTPTGLFKDPSATKEAEKKKTAADRNGIFEHNFHLYLYENKDHQFRLGLETRMNQDFAPLVTSSRASYRRTALMTSYDHQQRMFARGVGHAWDRFLVILAYGGWVGDTSTFNEFKSQRYFTGVVGSF